MATPKIEPEDIKALTQNLGSQARVEFAIKLTLLDAIEKGMTTANQAVKYMDTKAFKTSVKGYLELMK